MGEPVEGGSGEPLGAEDLDPGLEGKLLVTIRLVRSYAVEMTSNNSSAPTLEAGT